MDLQRLSRSRTEVSVPTDTDVWDLTSDEAAAAIETLNAETAREILARLYEGPATASEIAEATDNSLQNVNYHLGNLREANLIEIADTRYSRKGTEMKIYTPRTNAVVLLSRESTASRIKELLSRFVFGVAALGIAAVVFRSIVGRFVETAGVETFRDDAVDGDSAGRLEAQVEATHDVVAPVEEVPLLLDPGLVFFLAGMLVLLAVLFVRWRRTDVTRFA